MPLQWLKPIVDEKGNPILKPNGSPKYRRTLADKGRRVEAEQILKWLEENKWPYSWSVEFYELRDKALISLLYVMAARICEVVGDAKKGMLGLQRKQFDEQRDFLIVKEFEVEKNQVNPIRDDWALPKSGRLAPFTHIILEYLKELPTGRSDLFLIKRARSHQIVKHITGKWPHWFRSMGEAFYMRYVFKDPVRCASALRLRRSDTLIEYVPYEWKDYAKQLSA